MSRLGWVVLIAAVVAGGAYAVKRATRGSDEAPKFRKEKVDRGDVVQSVTASGTLSAVTTVKVGSQVSGIIASLHADFNSRVTTGQLLAELDAQPFQATVDQREADLERARAELRDAERELARSRRLGAEGILSQGELDAATARHDSASAVVRQAEAALRQARGNLDNTRITSPIDGVVVDRQYDIGQTVAASFQAPTLFTIARDLTKMQVLTNIDEADIGGVKTDQAATFTVDAFPDETFRGRVSQVRLAAQTVQNVVTYPVVIDVDNPEGRLRPGMTANVAIPVATREGVLRLPNAALRFRPDPALVAKDEAPAAASGAAPARGGGPEGAKAATGAPSRGGGAGGGWPGAGAGAGRGGNARRGSVAYVEVAGGKLKAVPVKTSITDGTMTALESDSLNEGDEVVTGLATVRAGSSSGGMAPGMGGMGGMGPRGMRP